MKFLKLALAALPLFFASACSQAGLFAANLPASGGHIYKNVAFGPADWQKLDIYMPPGAPQKNLDVLVFIHGGRWSTGSKDDYKFVGTAFAGQNFITVIPDFRKYPDVKFPVFAQDAAASLAWVMDHIQDYGGDLHKIHLAGHSSGAHIGALLAADPEYLKAFGKKPSAIRSFVGLSGPYAFTPDEPDLIDMFGPPDKYPQMQVPTFIDGHQPPMLLVYGGKDTSVKPVNLERLRDKIKDKGGCVVTKVYPDLDHIWTVGALSWLGRKKADVLGDMVWFFKDTDVHQCPEKL